MKRVISIFLLLTFVFSALPAVAADSYDRLDQDSLWDKAGDWFATLGKDKEESDMIIAERRSSRAVKRLGQAWRQETKKASKKMEQFGKDMERAFQ